VFVKLTLPVAVVFVAALASACGGDKTTQATSSATATSSVATTATQATAAPAATEPPPGGSTEVVCPLTVEQVTTAIGTVFPGPVTLEEEPGAPGCSFKVADEQWLHVAVAPYSANQLATIVINDMTAQYGGTTPQQVFDSAAKAFQSAADASGGERKFEQYPDIGGGVVSDGVGGFVLAGTHDFWYKGDFGINSDPAYNTVALNIAKEIAAH
jgi:hypothetical protein